MTDDLAFLTELLKEPDSNERSDSYVTDAEKFDRQSSQSGPLRYWDKEMRCTSTRCGSSTHYKLKGMPLCTTHALLKMNEWLTNEDE